MARLHYIDDKSGPISTQLPSREKTLMASKPGLYAAIHAKRARIAAGSGEKMRKPGTKGAPTAAAFKKSAKTAQKSLSGYGGLPAMKRIKPMKKGK